MIEFIEGLVRAAREEYGVDPVIFVGIYLVSAPIFYYSLFRTVRALAKKLQNEIMLWSFIFLCTIVAPFVYVLIFGRNLPLWVYVIIALIIGQGVFSMVRKLRDKPPASGDTGSETKA